MGISELALSTFLLKADNLFAYIKNLLNTIFKLNGISLIAHQANSIFQNIILYYLVFYINEIKSALSILKVVKQVFLNKSFL